MSSRDDPEKSYNVPLPDNNYVTVYLRDSMTNEEFLASACVRKNLNPMEHFVRVKKRREMEDHNYFVPHRNDLIETYVSVSLIQSNKWIRFPGFSLFIYDENKMRLNLLTLLLLLRIYVVAYPRGRRSVR